MTSFKHFAPQSFGSSQYNNNYKNNTYWELNNPWGITNNSNYNSNNNSSMNMNMNMNIYNHINTYNKAYNVYNHPNMFKKNSIILENSTTGPTTEMNINVTANVNGLKNQKKTKQVRINPINNYNLNVIKPSPKNRQSLLNKIVKSASSKNLYNNPIKLKDINSMSQSQKNLKQQTPIDYTNDEENNLKFDAPIDDFEDESIGDEIPIKSVELQTSKSVPLIEHAMNSSLISFGGRKIANNMDLYLSKKNSNSISMSNKSSLFVRKTPSNRNRAQTVDSNNYINNIKLNVNNVNIKLHKKVETPIYGINKGVPPPPNDTPTTPYQYDNLKGF